MIYEVLILAGFAGLVLYNIRKMGATHGTRQVDEKHANPQVEQALAYAARLYSEHKYLAAEKAYLAVLKYDHKNHVAYTRLGKIYISLKNYPDAIECFRIASQLSPNAHSYFNLGTGYYENKNYIKAIAAFEKAIMFEPSAGRYAALGSAQKKMSNWPKAASALEKAVELQPSRSNLQALQEAYRMTKRNDDALAIEKRLRGSANPAQPARPQPLS